MTRKEVTEFGSQDLGHDRSLFAHSSWRKYIIRFVPSMVGGSATALLAYAMPLHQCDVCCNAAGARLRRNGMIRELLHSDGTVTMLPASADGSGASLADGTTGD